MIAAKIFWLIENDNIKNKKQQPYYSTIVAF